MDHPLNIEMPPVEYLRVRNVSHPKMNDFNNFAYDFVLVYNNPDPYRI
jgi:hypothetical protein